MTQITYPSPLESGSIIGVTAPSTGIAPDLEERLNFCIEHVSSYGFEVRLGKCLRSANIVSAAALDRALELTQMLSDDSIGAIVPPWGGELLINILPLLDFVALAKLRPKWLVGFSDMSTFLMPYTMLTGVATIHGSNFMETAYNCAPTHKHWLAAISLTAGDSFTQKSADKYQTKFTRYQENPRVTEWNYAESVAWKLLGHEQNKSASVTVSGRLIGGCLDVVSKLPGTPFGDVEGFALKYAPEGLLLYLEVCEEIAPAACRMLHHLKLAGWFKPTRGILIGRTQAPNAQNFSQHDALADAISDIGVPVIYDMDIGHVPPQAILVNGAIATVHFGPNGNYIEQLLR